MDAAPVGEATPPQGQGLTTAGPPAWALGAALVVSGNIFEFWAVRASGQTLTIALGLIGVALRLFGLGTLIRWVLPFNTWWAYVVAVLLAAGMVTAILDLLAHF